MKKIVTSFFHNKALQVYFSNAGRFPMCKKWLMPVVFAVFVCMAQPAAAQEDQVTGQEDLAKKSQNPVGNMISVPIEYWHYDGMANDGSADALIVKPVYPVTIGKTTLINRFIVPYLGIDAHNGDDDLSLCNPQSDKSCDIPFISVELQKCMYSQLTTIFKFKIY